MKIKAGDLKHGQRFRLHGDTCVATGIIDGLGWVVVLHKWLDGTYHSRQIDSRELVELLDPANATVNCVAVGAGGGHVIAPTYRPYTEDEMLELFGKRVKRKGKLTKHGWLITIVDDGSTVVGHLPVNARQLLRDYEFLDGAACGVRE